MLARALEMAMGAPDDEDNPFAWATVEMNLPGMTGYDPGKPRVRRLRADGLIAAFIVSYFDDGRVAAPLKTLAEQALRRATSELQYLGNQDAARKRRPVSLRPGAWAGSVTYADQHAARKLISQKKWDRTKSDLCWFDDHVQNGLPMDRKTFRSKTGYLLHVMDTYDVGVPYLQGFFLSLNSWRRDRDCEGYRVKTAGSQSDRDTALEEDAEAVFTLEERVLFDLLDMEDDNVSPLNEAFLSSQQMGHSEQEPPTVSAVPRLEHDVKALTKNFQHDTPAQLLLRPARGAFSVVYGGGDASGEGFGSLVSPLGMEPLFNMGFWCSESSEHSSNWREFKNLLERLKSEAALGRLTQKEVWIATDNSTADLAFYKGRSSSPELDKMILELRILSVQANCIIHLVHIAGTRMIACGVDGLSRGELQVGALIQGSVGAMLPLHLSALERSP